MQVALELGEDHREHGTYDCGTLPNGICWTMSAGSIREAPSSWAKGDPRFPNEDALLVAEEDGRVLMCVADAHFGRQPSHDLVGEIALALQPFPRTPQLLRGHLLRMSSREPIDSPAGTSLVVAVYDRQTREGFGFSYFDSTFALIGPSGHRQPAPARRSGPIYLRDPRTLDPARAERFAFRADAGDLLLAYTDGVDECHYQQADTSVSPAEMERLFEITGTDAERFARATTELALAGVRGHPGGEDNLALVVVSG